MIKLKIGIASDHRGYEVKNKLIDALKKKYEIIDYGTNNTESTDYPVYAFKLCEDINKIDFGILLCGTGIGISIAANKVKKIRCARVVSIEDAYLARYHNNANVIALSSEQDIDKLIELIEKFINTEFSNESRHIRRNEMIDNYD